MQQKIPKAPRGAPEPAPITAVQRALDVLGSFSAAEPLLGVSEIARRIGVHKSTVSRILATLGTAGYVERDPLSGRFRLGAEVVALAGPLLSSLNVIELSRPYLQELAASSGETVTLAIWNRNEAIDVEMVPGPNPIKHLPPVGLRNPAHSTATGKVFLAHLPEDEARRFLPRELKRYTERTIVQREALWRELEAVRGQGYAVNDEEHEPGLAAVAAVVRDQRGAVAAAIAISVPKFRFTATRRDELARTVKRCAAELSRRMGYAGTMPE